MLREVMERGGEQVRHMLADLLAAMDRIELGTAKLALNSSLTPLFTASVIPGHGGLRPSSAGGSLPSWDNLTLDGVEYPAGASEPD